MSNLLNGKRMVVHLDCFPCFLRQTVIACNLATDDPALKERVIKAVLPVIGATDMALTPAHATTYMHRLIRDILACDPYLAIKREYNLKALALYPSLKKTVAESPDPLHTATRLAIAGNIIDFGIFASVDIEGTIERALQGPLAVDEYGAYRAAIDAHAEVLYLLDNAGEAVFDRILIEELLRMGKTVTAVVKGGPVINDVTAKDAIEAGFDGLCEVIDNGSDGIGTIVEMASPAFRDIYSRPGPLILSKGQGNFETLLGERRLIFHLFQSKCEVVSEVLGLPRGSMLLVGGP